MRVLVVGAAIDRAECGLFLGLKGEGLDISIVCESTSPHQEALRAGGISIVHRAIRNKFDISTIRFIRRKLDEEPFDVVYALTARALTTSLWATRGRREKVITYRGTVGHLSRLDPSAYLGFLNSRIAKVVCVSRAVEEYLFSKGVPRKRLLTIYKGHDPAWYEGGASVELSQFGVPHGVPVVGCTANMRPVKGVDVLVEAFGQISEKTQAHLLLIGEVRDPRIEALVQKHGLESRIHFTGFRPDAPQIVRSCSLFVMPSRAREGLPKAAIEAMSQGVVPVVSAVGGLPELVVDGVSGLVVPPSDPAALAAAICHLLQSESSRAQMSIEARRRIEGEFSVTKTVARMRVMFGEVAASL